MMPYLLLRISTTKKVKISFSFLNIFFKEVKDTEINPEAYKYHRKIELNSGPQLSEEAEEEKMIIDVHLML